jgi:hypothetical protein
MVSRGSAILPLHMGRAPKWLFNRMVELSRCIINEIIEEFGVTGFLDRISDPWFFQSLSCILAYDWHSSGTTTVTCGALKEAINIEENGLAVTGGKGKTSKKTPEEIQEKGEILGLNSDKIKTLQYASRISAKVDNCLIQDGYNLYHHTFMFNEKVDWIVIQQGINQKLGNARRYHWPRNHNNLLLEPEKSILCGTRLDQVLDMTHTDSEPNQKISVDLVKSNPRKLQHLFKKPLKHNQRSLDKWLGIKKQKILYMPRRVNWDALRDAYEFQPKNYEELVSMKGIGPSTIRGLALVAELIYGEKASWRDPVRFNFAFGGKDGVPFPVDRIAMDESIDLLKKGVLSSKVKTDVKRKTIKNLRKIVPEIPKNRLESLRL